MGTNAARANLKRHEQVRKKKKVDIKTKHLAGEEKKSASEFPSNQQVRTEPATYWSLTTPDTNSDLPQQT